MSAPVANIESESHLNSQRNNELQRNDSAGAPVVNSSLGSTCEICVQNDEKTDERRYRLQTRSAKLLPHHRVAGCMRNIVPGALGVSVGHSPSRGTANYRNLMTCASVWDCPVCSARITAQRREEISAALIAARQMGLYPVLITFTLQHNVQDELRTVLGALLDSCRAFKSGRGFQDLREQYGWQGSIRSLEVTYGANGWHPHNHELVFLDHQLTAPLLQGFRAWVAERWRHVLNKRGFDASWAHGVDVRTADQDIAEYVQKWGREPLEHRWGAADELARSPSKRASRDGFTPFQLLEAYGMSRHSDFWKLDGRILRTSRRAGALFVEYAEVFQGRKQLVWSRGLRELLQLGEEKSDGDLLDQVESDRVEMAFLLPSAWHEIVRRELRGKLLTVAASGDLSAVRNWLAQLGIVHYELNESRSAPPIHSFAKT